MFGSFRSLGPSIRAGYDAYQLSRKSSKVASALKEFYTYVDGNSKPSSRITFPLRSRGWLPSETQGNIDPSISRTPTKELLEQLLRPWLPTRPSIQDSAPAGPSSSGNDLSALEEARPPDEVQSPEAETSFRVPASSSFLVSSHACPRFTLNIQAWPKRQIQSITDRLKPTMSSLAAFRKKHLTSSLITDRINASQPHYDDDLHAIDNAPPASSISPTSAARGPDSITQTPQDSVVNPVSSISSVPPDLDMPDSHDKPEQTIDGVPPHQPERDLPHTQGEPDRTMNETKPDTTVDETGSMTAIDESRSDTTVTKVSSDTAKSNEASSINWSRL